MKTWIKTQIIGVWFEVPWEIDFLLLKIFDNDKFFGVFVLCQSLA